MSAERNYTRKTKKKKGKSALSRRQANAVRAIVEAELEEELELKYLDTTLTDASVISTYTNAQVYCLTEIPQGSDQSSRDGLAVTLKSLFVRARLEVGDETNELRFIMFMDRSENPDTTKPSLSDLLEADNILSPLELVNNRGRFRILFDKHFYLDTYNPALFWEKYIKLNTQKLWTSSAATSYEGKNGLYICVLSDSASVPHPLVSFYSRVRFTDA